MTKADVVRSILGRRSGKAAKEGFAFAAANIALCKYWGKRDDELNLPRTSSLSVSLRTRGTQSRIRVNPAGEQYKVNGELISETSAVHQRLRSFLDLFRGEQKFPFAVDTNSDIPLAAGLASSASVFASVVMALNKLFGWDLEPKALSILARLGSGSACRSIQDGFVEWVAGTSPDGMDSYGQQLRERWPGIRMGLLLLSSETKPIGSRPAMKRTRDTSLLYSAWPAQVEHDLVEVKCAIRQKDFQKLGQAAEANALAMHATMISSWPPVLYWLPESVEMMQRVWALREDGLPLFFTMDAGPNLKLLFLAENQEAVQKEFPGVEVVVPFAGE